MHEVFTEQEGEMCSTAGKEAIQGQQADAESSGSGGCTTIALGYMAQPTYAGGGNTADSPATHQTETIGNSALCSDFQGTDTTQEGSDAASH